MKSKDQIRIDDITPIDGREWPSSQAWKNFEAVYRPIVLKNKPQKELTSKEASTAP